MKHPSNKCVVVSEAETEVRSGSKGERKKRRDGERRAGGLEVWKQERMD